MTGKLKDRKIAILAVDGFEQSELLKPMEALEKEGAVVEIVSLKTGEIKGWSKSDWGESIAVDCSIDETDASEYDALMLPGGVINADTLRNEEKAVNFVKAFQSVGKPIAVICHGAWILIEVGSLEGRKLTSWKSLKTDLENAGAQWVDEEVVVDNGLVSSRKPDDLPAFNKKMVEEFAEGRHQVKVSKEELRAFDQGTIH